MVFSMPRYAPPDFETEALRTAPDARTEEVVLPGVAPDGFHAMSIFPEYIRIGGKWVLARESRMDCVAVLDREEGIRVVEFRNLERGDAVVLGRTEDGSEGILVHAAGFHGGEDDLSEPFAFRTGRSRETAYSRDFDELYDLLGHEREHGFIVWVLGPAVVFDFDSRSALAEIIRNGYAHAVLAGNALATHDLEGSLFGTALGQDIYTQEQRPGGHYNHLDLINKARECESLGEFVRSNGLSGGVVSAAVEKGIPLVLAGSIRDDGPLPGVIADVYKSQDSMRTIARKATTVIALATQLHTIATGNMTPSYVVRDGTVRPVFFYTVDISEFAVNKLRDRGSLSVTSIVTNVQDFLVHLRNNLCAPH